MSGKATPKIEDALARRIDQHVASVDEAYSAYDELRARCPVAHSDRIGGYTILTRHADVRAAALDWKSFTSTLGVTLPQDRTRPALKALEQDPPEHTEWRKRYTDAIVPEALAAMEPKIESIVDTLIDGFARRGTADLVAEFTEPLPVMGICAAIGLEGKKTADIRELALASTSTVADPDAQRQANRRMGEFILHELHDRRNAPKDDYLTRIAQMEIDGAPLNDYDLTMFMIGFLVAGHETTTSALSGLLAYVLPRPELKARLLEDDKAMTAAIEEAVRLTSPFHGFSRTATKEVDVNGVTIPEGEVVRLCWAAANRDPDVFPDPERFDIDRARNPHLGFGAGRHVCAGAPFARLEMKLATRRLLQRLPDIVPTQDDMTWHFIGGMMTMPHALEVRFTPT